MLLNVCVAKLAAWLLDSECLARARLARLARPRFVTLTRLEVVDVGRADASPADI